MAQHRRPDEEGWFRVSDIFGIIVVIVVASFAYFFTSTADEMSRAETYFITLVSSDGVTVEAREGDMVDTAYAVCSAASAPHDEIVLEVAVHFNLSVRDADLFVTRARDFCGTLP